MNEKQKAELFYELSKVVGPIISHLVLSVVSKVLTGDGHVDLKEVQKESAKLSKAERKNIVWGE